jgi:hypothetical protein
MANNGGQKRKQQLNEEDGSGDEVVSAIGQPLMQMCLGNQQKTRILAGTLEHTMLIPTGHSITNLMDEAGKSWTKIMEDRKAAKKDGTMDEDDEEPLGPPHLAKGMALLDGICQLEFNEEFHPLHQALKIYKADIENGPIEEAMSVIRQAWNVKCFAKEGQRQQMDRIVYTFEGTLMIQRADKTWRPIPVNQAVDTLMRQIGASQKGGPPPPLKAERHLKHLMIKLFEK